MHLGIDTDGVGLGQPLLRTVQRISDAEKASELDAPRPRMFPISKRTARGVQKGRPPSQTDRDTFHGLEFQFRSDF
jgi:hypothetical protein